MKELTESQKQKISRVLIWARVKRIVIIVLVIAVVLLLLRVSVNVYPSRSLVRQRACKDNQQVIRSQLEAYNLEYGFYPSESNWDNFLKDPHFWTPGSSAWVMYCPEGPDYPYEYKADTLFGNLPTTNEYGTGYPKYKLRCIYADAHNGD